MRDHNNETLAILAGIGIGAALMFFLDPHRNNGRRIEVNGNAPPTLRAVPDIEAARSELDNGAGLAEVPAIQMR